MEPKTLKETTFPTNTRFIVFECLRENIFDATFKGKKYFSLCSFFFIPTFHMCHVVGCQSSRNKVSSSHIVSASLANESFGSSLLPSYIYQYIEKLDQDVENPLCTESIPDLTKNMIFARLLRTMWDNVPEAEKLPTCLAFKLYTISFFRPQKFPCFFA